MAIHHIPVHRIYLSPRTHGCSESLEDDMHGFAIATNAVNVVNAMRRIELLTYVLVMDKLCYLGGTGRKQLKDSSCIQMIYYPDYSLLRGESS